MTNWDGIIYLMDLWMKYGKWGEFLTQKPYLADQVIIVYAILNQDISLLTSNVYYLLNSECANCIYQANLVCSLLSWTKLYISEPLTRISNLFQKRPQPSPNCHQQGLTFVISFISLLTILLSFTFYWI